MANEEPEFKTEVSGEHAIVENATTVAHAGTVAHAEYVQIHGEPIRSDRTRKLGYIRDIAAIGTILFALLVMVVTILDKNANENDWKAQLAQFKAERTASDDLVAKKLECVRRYTDQVEADRTDQLLLIGQFLVVITQNVPGPERSAMATDIGNQLDAVNLRTIEDVAAKVKYNNDGAPLPCPIPPTIAPVEGISQIKQLKAP